MKAGTDAGPRKGDGGGGGVRGVVQEETDELGKTETEGQLLGLKHMQGNEKRQDEYVMDGRANAVLQGRKRSWQWLDGVEEEEDGKEGKSAIAVRDEGWIRMDWKSSKAAF